MPILNKSRLFFVAVVVVVMFCFQVFQKASNGVISVGFDRNVYTSKKPPDPYSDLVIIYNRIPKTGSTSFMSVLYSLYEKNMFSVIYVNVTSRNRRFTFKDQNLFARNITTWVERKPAIYHGHFPFLNFQVMGFKQPVYVNIVREPLERLVSYYYFMRYGDTFLPKKRRKHQGDKRSFDECVKQKSNMCDASKLWLQIPFFCGSDPECWVHGNKKALERAKFNVVNYYFLVGVTEHIDQFVEFLESTIPSIFSGAMELFTKDGGVHIRKTKVKKPLKEETLEHFRNDPIYQMEYEFYMFVKDRFTDIARYSNNKVKVAYGKIKPDP
ncbi:heparan sulfate 2-O-sulfotransferase 1-like [Hydractinia symbiolongicarpus]|uniref:heparan sulfate 2-O-sulfotransferase 1-like n=1 Tax=Hydractinia symbiolongicarpus TaxID=13093 RepID=UPI00254C3AD7|nr:heparan sulfate 2-O-sulfotransferase 1-like [Hydractinia symbiolongicarpus]